MTVFVTRRIPRAGLEALERAGIEYEIGQADGNAALARDALLDGIRRHPVVLSLLTERIDRQALTVNPKLRGVSNMAVGLDNVDLAAARELGIPVGNTPDVLTEATADLAWALLLAAARRVVEGHAYMSGGRYSIWGPELLCGFDVGPGPNGRPRTLGVVGYGRIGAAVARRAAGFSMRVLTCGSRDACQRARADGVVPRSFEQLLDESDFISVHVPLTAATRHMFSAREFSRMREHAVFVNTARGPVVDESALVAALRSGHIGAAGLDVYEAEPAMTSGLEDLANVVLLPHVGSATRDTRACMAEMAAANAIRFLSEA